MQSQGFRFQGHRHIARCAMRRRTHDCRFCDRSHPLPPQLVDIKVFNHWARALRPWPGWRGLHSLINRADPSRAPCTNWCATTSRRSARRRRTCATDRGCRASSNKPPSRVALRRASPKPWRRREFRDFLTCGCLAAGFARFRCPECRLDRLVPFSCKSRGFCPSCGGRRMTDRAAHLVDHVFPAVPIRQCRGPRLRGLCAVGWSGC